MEVFSVFATLSLVDLISSPLAKIQGAMRGAEGGVNSFGASMGKLTMGMAPFAGAAAVVLGGLGLLAMSTLATEKALGELATLGVRDLAAVEAAALQASNTMAGITKPAFITAAYDIKSGIASLSDEGVAAFTTLAAKTAQATKATVADMTNLGATAYGIHKRMYAGLTDEAFGGMLYAGVASSVQAFKTTGAAMNQAMSNLGAAATQANRPLEEQLAVLGTLQNSMDASVAGTAYKSFFRDATRGFKALGINAVDATGQMRAMPDLLAALEQKFGSLEQADLDAITKAFGAETGAMIQNLLGKSDDLRRSIDGVGTAMRGGTGFINDMAASVNAGLGPSLALLRQRASGAVEELGKHLAPAFSALAATIGMVMIRLQEWAKTPFAGSVLKLVGGVSTAILAVTGLSAALWFGSRALPMLTKAFAPLKAALLGLSWPVLAIIAVVVALYAAYKTNFGGIADIVNRWGRTISVVVRGVIAIFESLTGTTFEIRGALAEEIRAEGLENLVVSVARIVWRIKEFFMGIWEGLNFDGAIAALTPAIMLIGDLFTAAGEAVAYAFGGSLSVAGSEANRLGEIVGMGLSWALEGVAVVISNVARGVDTLVSLFRWCAAILTGDWATAINMAWRIWDNLCASFMAFADLFRIGDWIRAAWTDAQTFLAGINLYESGAALLQTFVDGIKSMAMAPVNAVMEALQWVRDLLPFSDAKAGPLSELTASGGALMSTLAEGVMAGAGALYESVTGALGNVKETLVGWWGKAKSLWSGETLTTEIAAHTVPESYRPQPITPPVAEIAQTSPALARVNYGNNLVSTPPATPNYGNNLLPSQITAPVTVPEIKAPKVPIAEPAAFAASPDIDDPRTGQRRAGEGNTTITIHIGNIALPNVANGQDFVNDLQGLVAGYGGSAA